ncbi:MAG: DUF2804 domain-containing protein [Clostridia bacterium]|nr:DUF2804 domain-containing protein [Clostridia bacterium]MDR3643975.1 DUF2804 domain-containing protein [Clostridia bacterium]
MQRRMVEPQPLLDENGHLNQTGYATKLLLTYDRRAVKASRLRIKEWDYYLISNGDYALALTIADNSYMGLASVTLLDFRLPRQTSAGNMTLLPLGKTGFPSSSESGDVKFQGKKMKLEFLNDGAARHLLCEVKDFADHQDLRADITLTDAPAETMVIATPFKESPKAFYYNQKTNCLRAAGSITCGSAEYIFRKSDSFAVLDWGRGVWAYRNMWYWGSGSGMADGKTFGFNIGYGFGDTSAASENMLFYDGKASKLDQVTFVIPKKENGQDDFLRPWVFTSNDGRFEMDFVPILDRSSNDNLLIIASDQHQVFGRYTGKAVLDDGQEIRIRDFPGFAEKVRNKW